MHDNRDPIISRLFAEQDQSLASDDFVLKLGKRIDTQQRQRRVYRVVAIVVCLVLSALSAPSIAQITSTLIELIAVGISTAGTLLYVPLTWLVVVATVAGCSPVIYLWRTSRW
jgi:hypothetical protein